MYDIKDILRSLNLNSHYGVPSYYGWFPFKKGRDRMTFEIIRLILIMMEIGIESDFDDYQVVIYSQNPLSKVKTILYKDIPDCFNCIVHGFEIDLDNKIILIRSEVVKDGKI